MTRLLFLAIFLAAIAAALRLRHDARVWLPITDDLDVPGGWAP